MDTTLVSYMYRIKNIYVLLKGNETTDVTQVPYSFSELWDMWQYD